MRKGLVTLLFVWLLLPNAFTPLVQARRSQTASQVEAEPTYKPVTPGYKKGKQPFWYTRPQEEGPKKDREPISYTLEEYFENIDIGLGEKPEFEEPRLWRVDNTNNLHNVTDFDEVPWGDTKMVGLSSENAEGGFEKQHGGIVWKPEFGWDYDKPLFYVYQRFWAKFGDTWYKEYLLSAQKTPYYFEGDYKTVGWRGTLETSGLEFPFSMGIQTNGLQWKLKTNVTTPINLQNHGLEYLLYLNPEYVDEAKKIKYLKAYMNDNTTKTYDVTSFLDITTEIPNMVYGFSFLLNDNETEVSFFDFTDVFNGSNNRLIKIEQTELPNGANTYVIKLGATFGALSIGETLVIDPSFGNPNRGTNHFLLNPYYHGDKLLATLCNVPLGADTVYNVTALVQNNYAHNYYAAIYDINGNLVAKTPATAPGPLSSWTWVTMTFTTPVDISTYSNLYLAIRSPWHSPEKWSVVWYNKVGFEQSVVDDVLIPGDFPDPLNQTDDRRKYKGCMFSNYTGSGTYPTWWNTSWARKKQLTFNNSESSENLINFPVLVYLDSTNIHWDEVQDDLNDLRFIDSDETTELDYEIENSKTNDYAYIWVEVPQINASSADDYIWMYFSNPTAVSAEDVEGTWNNDFVGVWHMDYFPHISNDNVTEVATGDVMDSTANDNDGDLFYVSQDELNLWFPFEDGNTSTTIADYSTETNTGTWYGKALGDINVTSSYDGLDDAGYFDGTNDYLEVADHASLNITDELSIFAWVYGDNFSAGSGREIVWKRVYNQNTGYRFFKAQDNRTFCFQYGNGSAYETFYSASELQDDVWNHIGFVFNSSNVLFYLNGTLDATRTVTIGAISSNNESIWVGAYNNGGATDAEFDGYIDELQVYNRTLTQEEIEARERQWYQGSWSDSNARIDGIWTSPEGTGTNYISVNDSPELDFTTNMTIEFWINSNDIVSDQWVFSKGNTYNFRHFGNILYYYIYVGGVRKQAHYINALTVDSWYYIVGTFENTTLRLYRNGIQIDDTVQAGPIDTNNNPILIGKKVAGFRGDMDEMRLSNSTRSANWTYAQYLSMTDNFITFGPALPASPIYWDVGYNTTNAGSACEFSSWWQDIDGNCSHYIFGCNVTGTFTNDTATAFTANPERIGVVKDLPAYAGDIVAYQFWANDTDGLWNNTGLRTMLVTDIYYTSINPIDWEILAYPQPDNHYLFELPDRTPARLGYFYWWNHSTLEYDVVGNMDDFEKTGLNVIFMDFQNPWYDETNNVGSYTYNRSLGKYWYDAVFEEANKREDVYVLPMLWS